MITLHAIRTPSYVNMSELQGCKLTESLRNCCYHLKIANILGGGMHSPSAFLAAKVLQDLESYLNFVMEYDAPLKPLPRDMQAAESSGVDELGYETSKLHLRPDSENHSVSISQQEKETQAAKVTQPNSQSLGSNLWHSLQSGPALDSVPREAHLTGSLLKPEALTSHPPSITTHPDQPVGPNAAEQGSVSPLKRNDSAAQSNEPLTRPRPAPRQSVSQGPQISSSLDERGSVFPLEQNKSAAQSNEPLAPPRPVPRQSVSQSPQISSSLDERKANVKQSIQLAQDAENIGDYTTAQDKYNRALKIQKNMPKDPCTHLQIFRMKAGCSVKNKKYFRAIQTLTKGLKESKSTRNSPNLCIELIQVHFMLALIYRQIKQYQLEIFNLEAVLQMLPDDSDLVLELGGMIRRHLYLALMREGRSVDARNHLDLAQIGAGGNGGEVSQLLAAIEGLFSWEETVKIPESPEIDQPESGVPTMPHAEQVALPSGSIDSGVDQASVQGRAELVIDESDFS